MGLTEKIEVKIATVAAADLSKKASRGDFGPKFQAFWLGIQGKKTIFALALFLIVQALGQFTPPGWDRYMRYVDLTTAALVALGLLDKLRRKEPIFEPELLDALQAWSKWLAAVSGTVLGMTQAGLFLLLFPKYPGLSDHITLITTALVTATAFVNRAAAASAAQPQSPVAQITTTPERNIP
jgi:hypothetical protein